MLRDVTAGERSPGSECMVGDDQTPKGPVFWSGKNRGRGVLVFSLGKPDPDPELLLLVEVAKRPELPGYQERSEHEGLERVPRTFRTPLICE